MPSAQPPAPPEEFEQFEVGRGVRLLLLLSSGLDRPLSASTDRHSGPIHRALPHRHHVAPRDRVLGHRQGTAERSPANTEHLSRSTQGKAAGSRKPRPFQAHLHPGPSHGATRSAAARSDTARTTSQATHTRCPRRAIPAGPHRDSATREPQDHHGARRTTGSTCHR